MNEVKSNQDETRQDEEGHPKVRKNQWLHDGAIKPVGIRHEAMYSCRSQNNLWNAAVVGALLPNEPLYLLVQAIFRCPLAEAFAQDDQQINSCPRSPNLREQSRGPIYLMLHHTNVRSR
jgi:hypothetical protein